MTTNVDPLAIHHHQAGTPDPHDPHDYDARVPDRFSPYEGNYFGFWTNFGSNYAGEADGYGSNEWQWGCSGYLNHGNYCTISSGTPGGNVKQPNDSAQVFFGNGRHIVGQHFKQFHNDYPADGEESDFDAAPMPRFHVPPLYSYNFDVEVSDRFFVGECDHPNGGDKCDGKFKRPQLGQYSGRTADPHSSPGSSGAPTMCKLRGNKLWMYVSASIAQHNEFDRRGNQNWSHNYGYAVMVADIRETRDNQFSSMTGGTIPGQYIEAMVECWAVEVDRYNNDWAGSLHNFNFGGFGQYMPKQPYMPHYISSVGKEWLVSINTGHDNNQFWGSRWLIYATATNPYTGEVRRGQDDFKESRWNGVDTIYPHKMAEHDAPYCAGYNKEGTKIYLGQFSIAWDQDPHMSTTCLMDKGTESVLLDTPTFGSTPHWGYTIRAYDRIPENHKWKSKDLVIWHDGKLLGDGYNNEENKPLFCPMATTSLANAGVTIRTVEKDDTVKDETYNLYDDGSLSERQWCPVGGCLTPYGDAIVLMLSCRDLSNYSATSGPAHPDTGEPLYGEHWRLIRPGHWDIVWRKPQGAGITTDIGKNNYWGGFSIGFAGMSRPGSPVETHPGWINPWPFSPTDTADPVRNPYEDLCDDQTGWSPPWANASMLEGPRVTCNEKWVGLSCCPSRVTPSTHLVLGHTYPAFMSDQKNYETRLFDGDELERCQYNNLIVPANFKNNVFFDWLVDVETAEIHVPWRAVTAGNQGAGYTGWKHEGKRTEQPTNWQWGNAPGQGYDLVHLNTAHAAADPERNIANMPPRSYH